MVQIVGRQDFQLNAVIWEQDIWLIKGHFGFGFDECLEIGFSLLVILYDEGDIMSRSTNVNFAPLAKEFLGDFHSDIVSEVQRTVFEHDVVVIGMFLNPHVFSSMLEFHFLNFWWSWAPQGAPRGLPNFRL